MIAVTVEITVKILKCTFSAVSEQLSLEPAGELYVCSGGGMRIRCNTSAALLGWRVAIPGFPQETRSFELETDRVVGTPIIVNLAILNISRSFPLVIEIFTNNATADLNGALITCEEQISRINFTRTSASTRIYLIGSDGGSVNSKA